ncbi:MAG: hypothetical protein SynsKO_37210 [Synoicihabitans sp.]
MLVAFVFALPARAATNRILLNESFDGANLPELFTEGRGNWVVENHILTGQEQAADKHTAFRKIYLDHQDVRYAYDMRIEDDAFHQLLINWGLAHIAKVVIKIDEAQIIKIKELKKRQQMQSLGHDQGLDPLAGEWNHPNETLASMPLSLNRGRWYRVVIEMKADQISLEIDGKKISGRHIGITEKKDNFGFQAGGLAGKISFDNIVVTDLSE